MLGKITKTGLSNLALWIVRSEVFKRFRDRFARLLVDPRFLQFLNQIEIRMVQGVDSIQTIFLDAEHPWGRQRWVAYQYFPRKAPCQTEACRRLLRSTKRRTFRSKRHSEFLGRKSCLYRTFRKDFHRWCALRYQSRLVLQTHRPGSERKCCLAKCRRGHSPKNEGN